MTEDFKNSDVFSGDENVNDFLLVFNNTVLDKITNDKLNENFQSVSTDVKMGIDTLQNLLGIDIQKEIAIDVDEMVKQVAKR